MIEDNRPDLKDFTLHRDAFSRLVLRTASGQEYAGVEPVRAFPLSDPKHALSIVDSNGREIVYLDTLDELKGNSRRLVEEELAQREFVPIVRRIVNTPEDTEPAEWTVETDRGYATFQLDSEDNVHRHGEREVSIVDSKGIRYLVPDVKAVDAHSRRILERFLF